jgi:hypothetical protein
MDHSTRVAGYLAMIPDRSRSLSQPRRNLRHRQHLPLVKRVETVDEYPPARYAIPVVPGRRIVDGPNVDDDDVAYTVLAEGCCPCTRRRRGLPPGVSEALPSLFLWTVVYHGDDGEDRRAKPHSRFPLSDNGGSRPASVMEARTYRHA